MDAVPKAIHTNSQYAGKSMQFVPNGMDHEQAFNDHMNNPVTARRLVELSLDTPNSVTYTYNSHGFRTTEFDDNPVGLALGCSFTEGTGVPVQASWPEVLARLVNFSVKNLGVSGCSLDTCFRLLNHYIK